MLILRGKFLNLNKNSTRYIWGNMGARFFLCKLIPILMFKNGKFWRFRNMWNTVAVHWVSPKFDVLGLQIASKFLAIFQRSDWECCFFACSVCWCVSCHIINKEIFKLAGQVFGEIVVSMQKVHTYLYRNVDPQAADSCSLQRRHLQCTSIYS